MGDQTEKSCWNVTRWALLGFAAVLTVTYLVGLAGTGEVANVIVTSAG